MSHREGHGAVRPATPTPLPDAPSQSEAAAERITEDVLQLLFVAQQEIADLAAADDDHAALARLRVREAIAALREVVTLLHPGRVPTAVCPTAPADGVPWFAADATDAPPSAEAA